MSGTLPGVPQTLNEYLLKEKVKEGRAWVWGWKQQMQQDFMAGDPHMGTYHHVLFCSLTDSEPKSRWEMPMGFGEKNPVCIAYKNQCRHLHVRAGSGAM